MSELSITRVPAEKKMNGNDGDEQEIPSQDLCQVKLEEPSDEECSEEPSTSVNTKRNTRKRKNYSCVHCADMFNTAAELKKHKDTCQVNMLMTDGTHTVLCHFCQGCFNTKAELNRHISSMHITSAVALYKLQSLPPKQHLHCKYCNETYYTQRGLDSHIAKKHIAFEYGKKTPTLLTKLPEVEFHYPRVQKDLDLTNMNYEEKQIINLKAEFALKKNIFHENSKKFIIYCINCKNDYLETTFFDIHLPLCLKRSVFQCSFCGKLKSSIDEDIYRHIMKHFYKHSVYCKACNMHFVNSYNERCHKDKFHQIPSWVFEEKSNKGDSQGEIKEQQHQQNPLKMAAISIAKAALKLKLRSLDEVASKSVDQLTQNDETEIPATTNSLAHYVTEDESKSSQDIPIDTCPNFLKPSEKGRQNIYTRINCAVALPSDGDDTEVRDLIKDVKLEVGFNKFLMLKECIHVFCTKCNTSFQVMSYIEHVQLCFEPFESKCVFCSIIAQIKSPRDFLKHIKIHLIHHKKVLECSVCKMSYLNHFNYKGHSLQYHGSLVPPTQP